MIVHETFSFSWKKKNKRERFRLQWGGRTELEEASLAYYIAFYGFLVLVKR